MSNQSPEANYHMIPADPGLQQLLAPPYELPAEHQHAPLSIAREAELRRLLDPPTTDYKGRAVTYGNFETARDLGLIDMFAYEPEIGRDGLMHLLIGEAARDASGRRTIEGFHINHDPDYVDTVYHSRVEEGHMEGASSKHRRRYVRHPFEPHKAQVVIAGYEKNEVKTDEEGKLQVAPVDNNMFPREYDPLAALQAIRIARDGRDKSQDIIKDGKIFAKGSAPLIDGKTPMDMYLILTPEEKVITAFPRSKESGYMKLTDMAIDEALGISTRVKAEHGSNTTG